MLCKKKDGAAKSTFQQYDAKQNNVFLINIQTLLQQNSGQLPKLSIFS